MNRICELNHGLGVPPHHLALWTQLFTVHTVRMVQKATGRVGTVTRNGGEPWFWVTEFLLMDFLRSGFWRGSADLGYLLPKVQKNLQRHCTHYQSAFQGTVSAQKKIHTMGPDWIIFSTFITVYHLLPGFTNDYHGSNVVPEWSYGGCNGDSG